MNHLSAPLDFHKTKYQVLHLAILTRNAPICAADVPALVLHRDILSLPRIPVRIDFPEH